MEIKNKKFILSLLAFLGFVVSIELTYIYFKANFIAGAAPSFCTINDFIDCDSVAKTAYSLFLGIPNAVYGIGFYLLIMFLALFPFQKFNFFKNFKNPESYIFTLSSLAVISSVILWIISTFAIHKVCLLCYVLYGVNFFLFVFSKPGKSILDRYKESFEDFIAIISDTKWFIIVVSLVCVLVGLIIAANITKVFIPPVNNILNNTETQQGNTYQSTGNVLGSENPKLVIHEFTDFQCPYCAYSHLMLDRLVSEVPDVRVEHHDFPLNKACNPMVKYSPHKFSCEAVFYARAAKEQGKYWDYINLLFDNQNNLSDSKFLELGKDLNLNTNQLKKDASSPEVRIELKEDLKMAQEENIKATPTYIMIVGIKKYKYEGIMPYPQLKDIVLQNLGQ
jgi:protein-disulfide isomerase/uncharacterized membrane protein